MHGMAYRGAVAPASAIPLPLQQALQSWTGLMETLPVGIYTCGRDGLLVQYNRRAAELWGRAPVPGDAHVRFCGAWKAYRPDGQPLDLSDAPMAELLRSGAPVRDRELVVERPDGTRIVILANLDPLLDEAGELIGAVNCFQDITEAKRTEQALREQQRDLDDFFENGAVALHLVGSDGTILRANQAELDLLGYSREEYVGRNIADFHADRPVIEDILARLCGGQKLDKYPARLRTKDGSIKHVLISSNVQFRAGKFVNTRCFTLDVTDQKRADDELRASEQRYRGLIEALPAAVYTTDAEGRITFYNQAAVDLSGRRPELGNDKWCVTWRMYLPDGTPLPHDQCPMAVALKEDRPIRDVEAVAERPDGTRVPFLPYPTPLHDAAGRLVGAVNMLVDISERKQAETRQKLLVDELNHRVKNTLATVQSLASQTARRAQSPDAFREDLEGRLIALSRAHDQLSQRNWEHADLREIALASLAPYNREAGDAITVSGEPIVLTPKSALTFAMIFHELATNAAKYGALSQPDGRLALDWKAERNGAGPKLRVRWRESGGPAVAPPTRRGFGSMLVERGIEAELGGVARLDFAPAGLSCNIEVPLANTM